MSIRGPTGKFFYDRVHDLYLYYLILENHVFDEAQDDYVYTRSGDIKIAGGWELIAEKMTAIFGREFKPKQMRSRYDLFSSKEKYLDELFNEVSDFRDDFVRIQEVMDA